MAIEHYKLKGFRINDKTVKQLKKIKLDGDFKSFNKTFIHLINIHYRFMENKLTKEQKERLKELTRVSIGDFCPHCKIGTIKLKKSRFGEFLACDEFPRCAFTQKIN